MPIPGAEPGGCYLGASFSFSALGAGANKVTVHGVLPDGPAEKAGLQPQDVLMKFGDDNVANTITFLSGLSKYKPGEEVKVVFERDGEEKTVTVKLTKRE